jgi:Mg2+-importing ATPase
VSKNLLGTYWNHKPEELLRELGASPDGLSEAAARKRLSEFGPNALAARQKASGFQLLLRQVKNPLVLILLAATAVSFFAGEQLGAIIIFLIVLGSIGLSFYQEYSAANAMEKLRSRISLKCRVLRDGKEQDIFAEEVVPGEVVMLSAGSIVPADGVLIDANILYINQASLTGESVAVGKKVGVSPKNASLAHRSNCAFMGTHVQSGSGKLLVVQTGRETAYGEIAEEIAKEAPETEFERGARSFGILLTRIMFILVIGAFIVNVIFARPIIDSLLFSIALAVGLTPELLPAIISVNLSRGAQTMAKKGVLMRRLRAIENLGSMDVLCADKTGTLTEGVLKLDKCLDVDGAESELVYYLASLNTFFEEGWKNPLDVAIRDKGPKPNLEGIKKVDEIPFDFERKRLTVVLRKGEEYRLVTKGAVENIFSSCSRILIGNREQSLTAARKKAIHKAIEEWSGQGYRVLAVATRSIGKQEDYLPKDEKTMTLHGFLLFYDPPKKGIVHVIEELAKLGVNLKLISGDHHLVTRHVAELVGLKGRNVVTGSQLQRLTDTKLRKLVEETQLFAEVDPRQKERILEALHKNDHVLGYMGDGINDAPSLHVADVGISVDTAVEVAKEAADFVLLKRDLSVLKEGILAGRQTFANSMKYIYITSSSNFGNVFSMAGATLFLPFLPLLPFQILLTNFLTDIPAFSLANDEVDPELVAKPRRWNLHFLRDYMLAFGFLSSLFDYLTFGLLILVLGASQEEFHTGWFIESVMTELLFLLIIRTRRPFMRSKPSLALMISTILVGIVALALPFLPQLGADLGFVPLPLNLAIGLVIVTVLFILSAEIGKALFFRFEKEQ